MFGFFETVIIVMTLFVFSNKIHHFLEFFRNFLFCFSFLMGIRVRGNKERNTRVGGMAEV